jgi:hypothetical protein
MSIQNAGSVGDVPFDLPESDDAAPGPGGGVESQAVVERGSVPAGVDRLSAAHVLSGIEDKLAASPPALSTISSEGSLGAIGSEGIELLTIAGADGSSVAIRESEVQQPPPYPAYVGNVPAIKLSVLDAAGEESARSIYFGEGVETPYLGEFQEAGVHLRDAVMARRTLDTVRQHLAAAGLDGAPLDGSVARADVERTRGVLEPMLQNAEQAIAAQERLMDLSPEAKLSAETYAALVEGWDTLDAGALKALQGPLRDAIASVGDQAKLSSEERDAVEQDLAFVGSMLQTHLEDVASGVRS